MSPTLPTSLRRLVEARASKKCEYCRLPQTASLHKHEPDHIILRQHGGTTDASNLALACFRCNRYKGPNVGSFDPETGELVPFFNPRNQVWKTHFAFDEATLRPLTAEARVTIKILRLNDDKRVAERIRLIKAGLYA
ncbi:MAG: HNH endonuclease [Chloroflexi bacterium]|nr:HNH endonuclease [Chloroflexota bacterium]